MYSEYFYLPIFCWSLQGGPCAEHSIENPAMKESAGSVYSLLPSPSVRSGGITHVRSLYAKVTSKKEKKPFVCYKSGCFPN